MLTRCPPYLPYHRQLTTSEQVKEFLQRHVIEEEALVGESAALLEQPAAPAGEQPAAPAEEQLAVSQEEKEVEVLVAAVVAAQEQAETAVLQPACCICPPPNLPAAPGAPRPSQSPPCCPAARVHPAVRPGPPDTTASQHILTTWLRLMASRARPGPAGRQRRRPVAVATGGGGVAESRCSPLESAAGNVAELLSALQSRQSSRVW